MTNVIQETQSATETRSGAGDKGMQPFPVVFFADFTCPYSYIAQAQVDNLIRDYGVQPLWRPHWLHPDMPPEGRPYAADPERRKATLAWLREMEPEKAAPMRLPDKQQFSFHAFEALEYAEDHGLALPFKSAVFDALWVEGKDIGQANTLMEAADKVGLNAEELGRALHERTYALRALEAVMTAAKIGVTATPTVFLGRAKIIGWHYYEVFQTVLAQQGISPKVATAATAQA